MLWGVKSLVYLFLMNEKQITRVAPSPTGDLHLGGARTALFNYLFARKNGGKFILRIEDTDTTRSEKKYETGICDALRWMGLSWDDTYRQSDRTDAYKKAIQALIEKGHVYRTKEEKKGTTTGELIDLVRFKNPNTEIVFNDLVRGKISFNTTELGDFVIARGKEDEALYHLAVVVDDEYSGITTIIRGEDHISNTPRQLLLREALGYPPVSYAHISLTHAEGGGKLSKRTGATSVAWFKEHYLPEAFVNYIAFLGWNPGDDREIYTLEELIKVFSLDGFQKQSAVFNIKKLDWYNKEYIKMLPKDTLKSIVYECIPSFIKELPLYSEERLLSILPEIRSRSTRLSDIRLAFERGEYTFFFSQPTITDPLELVWRDSSKEKTKNHLENIYTLVEALPEWDGALLKKVLFPYAEKEGRGEVLWPFRFSLSGLPASPDPFGIAFILGKEETLKRIRTAITLLT